MKLLIALLSLILIFRTGAYAEAAHEHELQLNHGQRWGADAHTTDSVRKMNAVLQSAAAQKEDVQAVRQTGSLIQDRLNSLIAGCRMTGPAHEQLHVYLGRLIPAIRKLETVSSPAAASEAYDSLHAVLLEYDRYFEAEKR